MKPQRTPVLWILAILTMINTFFSAIAYISWAFAPDVMSASMEMVKTSGILSADQADQVLAIYTSISTWQYIALAFVQALLFSGAFLMLARLNPLGFHFYTIGQILQFCVMNFMIGGKVAMGVNAIIVAVLWVLMYATQLRYMKKRDVAENNSENNTETEI